MADQVLYSGVACITDLMVKEGLINLDFADVRAVMREMGKAMMGTGEASGEKRALSAAEAAISNPLIDDSSMKGARGLLISITGGRDLTLYEVDEAATRIREEVDQDANIIVGATFDENLEGIIRVAVVATGIDQAASGRPVVAPESRLAEIAHKLRVRSAASHRAGGAGRVAASGRAPGACAGSNVARGRVGRPRRGGGGRDADHLDRGRYDSSDAAQAVPVSGSGHQRAAGVRAGLAAGFHSTGSGACGQSPATHATNRRAADPGAKRAARSAGRRTGRRAS